MLINEAVVVSINNRYTGHWIVKPSSDFSNLSSEIQQINKEETSIHHGIYWEDVNLENQRIEYSSIVRKKD